MFLLAECETQVHTSVDRKKWKCLCISKRYSRYILSKDSPIFTARDWVITHYMKHCYISLSPATIIWNIAAFRCPLPPLYETLLHFAVPCHHYMKHCCISLSRATIIWNIAAFRCPLPPVPRYTAIISNFFFHGSTASCGPRLPLAEVPWSYSDTSHSLGLLWTSNRLVAETSTSYNTHSIHKKQASMPLSRPELAVPTSKLPQTQTLDRAATGIGKDKQ
jgi:hypothetical protein